MVDFDIQLYELGSKVKEFMKSEQMEPLQRYCEIISNIRRRGFIYEL